MASKLTNKFFSSDNISPGYVESVASSKKKTKENLRTKELVPSEILANASALETLLNAYYDYMNLEEFIYQETETFSEVVLDNKAVFRVSDPRNENDHFFTDEDGANSTLVLTDAAGNTTNITLNDANVAITNGNNLPGSLANSLSEIGKTFTVSDLDAHNTKTATLTTPIKFWAGPGASFALNTIEDAMDIDSAAANYLELIQKEIAAVIPRSIQVNKRTLYKSIIDYYKIRGSADSIEVFFRLLFNDTVEIEYPYDKTLIPSSGNFDTSQNRYIDNKGFLSDDIKIHDSDFYQKFSYLIRTGQNLSSWNDVYSRLVHPAGFKYFAEILLQLFATRDALGDDEKESSFLSNYSGGTDSSGTDFRPSGSLRFREYPSGTSENPRLTLSSMPGKQPGVIGIEDLPLLVEMFASVFLPFTFAQIHKSASISLTVSGGQVTGATINEPGFGYSSAPTITVNGVPTSGNTISNATVTCTIDSEGKIETVTVSGAGANYQSAFASVAANPNVGKVASISIVANENKSYSEPPGITIDAPTSVDENGLPLSSNVTAIAKYLLQPTSVSHIELISGGSNYTVPPAVNISAPPSGVTATAVAHIENGSVSNIEITNAGSGYVELPTITIGGNATAKAQLTPSEIASVSIVNAGANYVLNPNITLASRPKHEDRVKHKDQTIILELNHTYDDPQFTTQTNPVQSTGSVTGRTLYNGGLLKVGALSSGQNWTISQGSTSTKTMGGYEVLVKAAGYRTQPGNNYYSQKTNILNNYRLYDFNETIEFLGSTELQSTSITDINKYNVNSFIHTN